MTRALVVLCLALPLGAAAQPFMLTPPSMYDAMRNMDHMHDMAARRGLADRERRELEQTFVLPERPGQNQVSWYEFDWHHYDVPSPSGGQGGLRLYFYRRGREAAQRALPVIRNAYLSLVD